MFCGVFGRFLGGIGELNPAGLHAAAGQYLGFDHGRPADVLGDLACLVSCLAEAVLGDRDTGQLDDLSCLIFVEAHRKAKIYSMPGHEVIPIQALGIARL